MHLNCLDFVFFALIFHVDISVCLYSYTWHDIFVLTFSQTQCLYQTFIRNNDELRKDAVDALCCLAYSLGEDFSKFIRLIDKLLSKHHMRVFACSLDCFTGACKLMNILMLISCFIAYEL